MPTSFILSVVASVLLLSNSQLGAADAPAATPAPEAAPSLAPAAENASLPAAEYLERYFLDAPDSNLVRLSPPTDLKVGEKQISETWKGTIREGFKLRLEKEEAELGEVGEAWTSFTLPTAVPTASGIRVFTVIDKASGGEVAHYNLLSHWKRLPSGHEKRFTADVTVQAFAEGEPALEFNSAMPPKTLVVRVLSAIEAKAKRWVLTWRSPSGDTLFSKDGTGVIPAVIPWPEDVLVMVPGKHTYALEIDSKKVSIHELNVTPYPSGIFELKNFLAGTVAAFQVAGGNVVTVGVGWSPRYRLTNRWELRGDLFTSAFKSSTGSLFPVFDYNLSAGFRFWKAFFVHGYGGAETWVLTGGGTAAVVGGRIGYRRGFSNWGKTLTKWVPWWDRLELAYSIRLGSPSTHAVQLSLGAQF